MRELNKYFENRSINYKKLMDYGFKNVDGKYLYEVKICDNCFKVVVEVSKLRQTSKVIDLVVDEEYVLVDIEGSTGDFVGRVKEEYEVVLNDIFLNCTDYNVFKSRQAKAVIKYVKEKYNDDLEYLWKKFPNNAVWRNKKNNKWYGALLVIKENKLGIESDKEVEIIDLRYQKDKICGVVDNEYIFKGYHMNKDNWVTVKLDGSVDIREIYKLIDNSYSLSLEK